MPPPKGINKKQYVELIMNEYREIYWKFWENYDVSL